MIKNIFFDRDGTLGELSDIRYPQTIKFFSDMQSTIDLLKKKGYKLFIASNQSCIARGTDGGYDYGAEFAKIGFDDWFICPHDKYDDCSCRKPKTGLLDAAINKYGLVREECVIVGDRDTDVKCGKDAKIKTILLSNGKIGYSQKPDYVINNLTELLNIL